MTLPRRYLLLTSAKSAFRQILIIAGVVQLCLADKAPGFAPLSSSADYKSSATNYGVPSSSNTAGSQSSGELLNLRIVSGSSNARDIGVSNSNYIPPFSDTYSTTQTKTYGQTGVSDTNSFEQTYGGAQNLPSYSSSYGAAQSGSSYTPTKPADAGQSYTYHYEHYPHGNTGYGSSHASVGGHHGHGEEGGLLDGFGEGGFGIAGIGGLKALGLIAKGVLAIKPFILIGLLALLLIPLLLLVVPIPIITITTPNGETLPGTGNTGRLNSDRVLSKTGSLVSTYLTELSSKVLNAEECLERILCKMPQAPENYQRKAKMLWETYGVSLVKNARLQKGLGAYFEEQDRKNRNFKCNQKFRCSNKFL